MKYFEINEPYYALIQAESEEKAIEIYIENIADDEDNSLKEEITEIDKCTAFFNYANCVDEYAPIKRVLEDFENEEILLVDSNLL
jgi:hypothetical protein